MASEWPECRFEDLASPEIGSIAIGPFGSRLKAESYVSDGVVVIRGTNLGPGTPLVGDFVFITPEKASELGNANLKGSDLVFPHRGAIGEVGIVPNDGRQYVLSTSLMKISLDQSRAIPEFYYLFFKSPRGRAELLKNASQVGTPGIATPLKSLRECVVPCPTPEEQFEAVDLLLSIDSRIRNLGETNATLEAIAQALFKSWFVDFDPVRAKAEGREPEGMDAATAALFPSEFEDSELGPIPVGWRCGQLGDVLSLVTERAKAGPTTERLRYVPIEAIPSRSVILDQAMPGELAQSSLILFRANDILFGSMRPYFHKVVIAPFDGVTRTTVFVLRAEEETRCFALLAASQTSTIEFATAHSHGSTIPYAKWAESLDRMPLVIPPPEAMRAFGSLVTPLLEAGASNAIKQQMLADLRDTLLPRLISGKLRLREEAAQALAEA